MSEHPSTCSPSTSVVMAAARRLDREPTDLPPLLETIDPDALDGVFATRGSRRPRGADGREVRFRYAGLDVRVRGDGSVTVRTEDDDAPAGPRDDP